MQAWHGNQSPTGYYQDWGKEVKASGLEEWMAMYEAGVMCQRYDELTEENVLSEEKFQWVKVEQIPGCLETVPEP